MNEENSVRACFRLRFVGRPVLVKLPENFSRLTIAMQGATNSDPLGALVNQEDEVSGVLIDIEPGGIWPCGTAAVIAGTSSNIGRPLNR